MKKRAVSAAMMESLLSGDLQPMLRAVQYDDTLCMELRGKFVSVYYRGGSLFKITEKPGGYELAFDTNYCLEAQDQLSGHPDIETAVQLIPQYKQAMDFWFHRHPKYEREFQQIILRENNNQEYREPLTMKYLVPIQMTNLSI